MSGYAAVARSIAVAFAFAAVALQGRASPLFDGTGTLEVELRGPVGAVVDGKSDGEELDFELATGGRQLPVRVRRRGNSRLEVCDFPPLRLNFAAGKTTAGTEFAGQNHLKLVTHCNTRRHDANNVFNEYLAYRILNILADSSYRVRLLHLTYRDSGARTGDDPLRQYGFLIESAREFAARTGFASVRLKGIVYSRLDHDRAALVYVFHYLIGNTDWSLVAPFNSEVCCHNGDIFEAQDKYLLVPYDFDLSGLVDASYAAPDGSLPIRSVRTRFYRGYCTERPVLAGALRHVVALRADIRAAAEQVPASDARAVKRRLEFVDGFFERADDGERLLKSFEQRCL